MHNALIISYYFPPMGGVGVQRTYKFAKYLPDFGWQPHILTVRKSTGLQDLSLEKEISTELPVTRTHILLPPPYLPWRLRNFITRWFLIVDEQLGWYPFAAQAGRKIAEENNIKVIYSSSAPYTSHLIARSIHRQTHLPWVADFRDPWLENPFIDPPTPIHQQLLEHLERRLFTEADRVILNTVRTKQHYIKKYSLMPPEKFITIPNGYDQTDFPDDGIDRPGNPKFTITHLGSLYQHTRSGKFFLSAIHQAFESGLLARDKVQLILIGSVDQETLDTINNLNLSAIVRSLGYLPHQQALQQLITADLLLLIPSYGKGSDLFVPAKLYEYLACQKPILCLAEPGEAADLIQKTHSGSVVQPADAGKIIEQLLCLYQCWQAGDLKISPDMQLIRQYERRYLTSQLADLFSEFDHA